MKIFTTFLFLSLLISCSGQNKELNGQTCGPQTPRDIGNYFGENMTDFAMAKDYKKLNLCNIHFHKNAEHKGPGFSVLKGEGKHDGFACNQKVDKSQKKFMPFGKGACKNIEAGDTIEVHWVHSSCDIEPGPTLGACLSDTCKDPLLRVETQVFLLVNDRNAPSFKDYTSIRKKGKVFQTSNLPSRKDAVTFRGSTTGPSFNNKCSPFNVTWNVTPKCKTLDVKSVHDWCANNVFKEDHAQGIRKLVKEPKLLAPIN